MAKMDRFNLRSKCNFTELSCQMSALWTMGFQSGTFSPNLITMSQQRIIEHLQTSSIWVEDFGFGHREWVVRILSRDKSKNWSLTFDLFTADTDKGNWEKVLNWTAIVGPVITKVITEKKLWINKGTPEVPSAFSKIYELSKSSF